MEKTFWAIGGLGVCAALLFPQPVENSIRIAASLLITILITRFMMIMCDINEKMSDICAILLLEDEDEQIYHPPYDIDPPDDEP